jgi:hypothetical protein
MKNLRLTEGAIRIMDSRSALSPTAMDGYSNRKTRRVFASLLRRRHLEKLPERLFPVVFITYFILNYPEVCNGGPANRKG